MVNDFDAENDVVVDSVAENEEVTLPEVVTLGLVDASTVSELDLVLLAVGLGVGQLQHPFREVVF